MASTRSLAAIAAAVFSAGTIALIAVPAHSQSTVKCIGSNSCKGTSACKTAASACKGMNSCKGTGWSEAANSDACKKAGGIGIKFQT